MKKRNIYFGFGPAPKSERLTVYRRPKGSGRATTAGRIRARQTSPKSDAGRADLISALVNLGYKRPAAVKAAGRARGSNFDAQLRDALRGLKENPMKRMTRILTTRPIYSAMKEGNRIVYFGPDGRPISASMVPSKERKKLEDQFKNPRHFPGDLSPRAVKALRKLERAKRMKSKRKKKPSRRRNARRKISVRRRKIVRRRRINPRVRAFRKRSRKVIRRRRSSSRPARPHTVKVPFPMTPAQTKKYARQLARATGKRVIIKKR